MSAVRDVVAEHIGITEPDFGVADAIVAAIASLPLAARIAYAQELLAGSEWVVTRVPDASNRAEPWWDGWNACRAAVLAASKETPDV